MVCYTIIMEVFPAYQKKACKDGEITLLKGGTVMIKTYAKLLFFLFMPSVFLSGFLYSNHLSQMVQYFEISPVYLMVFTNGLLLLIGIFLALLGRQICTGLSMFQGLLVLLPNLAAIIILLLQPFFRNFYFIEIHNLYPVLTLSSGFYLFYLILFIHLRVGKRKQNE